MSFCGRVGRNGFFYTYQSRRTVSEELREVLRWKMTCPPLPRSVSPPRFSPLYPIRSPPSYVLRQSPGRREEYISSFSLPLYLLSPLTLVPLYGCGLRRRWWRFAESKTQCSPSFFRTGRFSLGVTKGLVGSYLVIKTCAGTKGILYIRGPPIPSLS